MRQKQTGSPSGRAGFADEEMLIVKKRTLLQGFEWYLPDDGQHWNWTGKQAEFWEQLGISSVWLPPAYKGASGTKDVGYGVYDTYDLGEFDQKGTVRTKYGTKEEYLGAIRTLHDHHLEVLPDIVLNHRMGADECEEVQAYQDASDNRNREISGKTRIGAWTKFTFPRRNGKYSDFQWNRSHFDGVDWDDKKHSSAVYRFEGKEWDGEVDTEHGNYDYLMGADLDMGNQEVIEELDRWGKWYLEMTGADGFRLDAVKHIRFSFFHHWLEKLRAESGRELFAVGEYWSPEVKSLTHYLDCCGQVMSLFDVPLHFNLHKASVGGGNFDMRHIFDGTLVQQRPELAVTFVDNHDTQPGQALQSWVEGWFKPLAYALLLLREEGTPCVFFGDLYGIPHDRIGAVPSLPVMLRLRRTAALGRQTDYFDHANIIGWTRAGAEEIRGSGMAVLMSDGPGGEKKMCLGAEHAGEVLTDRTGGRKERITLDETGSAVFYVNGGSVSVWVPEANEEK